MKWTAWRHECPDPHPMSYGRKKGHCPRCDVITTVAEYFCQGCAPLAMEYDNLFNESCKAKETLKKLNDKLKEIQDQFEGLKPWPMEVPGSQVIQDAWVEECKAEKAELDRHRYK